MITRDIISDTTIVFPKSAYDNISVFRLISRAGGACSVGTVLLDKDQRSDYNVSRSPRNAVLTLIIVHDVGSSAFGKISLLHSRIVHAQCSGRACMS